MSKEEEIAIILRRLPEQQLYVNERCSTYYQRYYSYFGMQKEHRDHILKREREVFDSSMDAFNNLVTRLTELLNVNTRQT